MNIFSIVAQVGLTTCGVAAVFLTNSKNPKVVRYASIAGLTAEPFWLYSGWSTEQWGIVILSFVYGYCWYRGFKRDWLMPKEAA